MAASSAVIATEVEIRIFHSKEVERRRSRIFIDVRSFANTGIDAAVVWGLGIGPAKFVQVRNWQVTAFGNRNWRYVLLIAIDGKAAAQLVQRGLRGAFVEEVEAIVACGDVPQFECSLPLADIEVRRVEDRDHRAHGGVNVAKDAHDAGLRELYAFGSAGRIKRQVERLAVIGREDVMEDRIEIREVYDGACRNGQHVRRKGLVFLGHARANGGLLKRLAVKGLQPNHHTRKILLLPNGGFLGVAQFDSAVEGCGAQGGRAQQAKTNTQAPNHNEEISAFPSSGKWCAFGKPRNSPRHSSRICTLYFRHKTDFYLSIPWKDPNCDLLPARHTH